MQMQSHPGSCEKKKKKNEEMLYVPRHARISNHNPPLREEKSKVQGGVYKLSKREGLYVLLKYV